jgi:hypothetical protein
MTAERALILEDLILVPMDRQSLSRLISTENDPNKKRPGSYRIGTPEQPSPGTAHCQIMILCEICEFHLGARHMAQIGVKLDAQQITTLERKASCKM